MTCLTLFRTSSAEQQHDVPAMIISGAPRTSSRVHATAEGGRLSAGYWEAEVGSWRVAYHEWEFCHIIAGFAVLNEDCGASVDVGPGDSFVIAPGFIGSWDVREPVTKHFVILDPPA